MNEESNATPQVETENLNKTFEEKIEDAKKKMLDLSPLICGIGIAIWWIFYGMVEIVPTNLSIEQRIGLTVITIFIAIVYCSLISAGGYTDAKNTKAYKTAAAEWTKAIKNGNSHKAEIIEYAKDIARVNQKELRTQNLENQGLQYNEIFDDKGELIRLDYETNKYHKIKNPSGYTKKQIKVIKKCINIRIQVPEMFGNISSRFFGIQRRTSVKEFDTKNTIKNTIVRSVVAMFSVGISFSFLGLTWNAAIYALFQIVLWTGSGVVDRNKKYHFIIDKILPQIVENTLMINGYLELAEENKAIYRERAKEEAERKNRKQIPYGLQIVAETSQK